MSNPPSKWSDAKDNMCEICGNQADAGILGDDKYIQTRIRYACDDHYFELYTRLVAEQKEEREREKKRDDGKK
jgi:CRISPR/Cas system-associated protein Cas10 (large subunit of type III CRISPR-Cas system)